MTCILSCHWSLCVCVPAGPRVIVNLDPGNSDFPVCLTPVEPVATPPMQPEPVRVSTYLNFQYGVDSAVRKAIAQRTIHEWTVQELRSICRGHALNVRGCKSDLLQRVIAHFGKK